MSFTTHDKIAAIGSFDNIYKFTDHISQFSDSVTSIISRFYGLFWLFDPHNCKSSHRWSGDNLLFKNLVQV